MQMSECHLAGNYTLFLLFTEHGDAKSENWCNFNRLELPSGVTVPRRCPHVQIICYLSILYVYCTFESCLFCVLLLFWFYALKISTVISLVPTSVPFPKCTANLLSARCVRGLFKK